MSTKDTKISETCLELAQQSAAQAWGQKEIDPVLYDAFTGILQRWIECYALEHQNTEFYRGLLDECAKAIGSRAYTADDGSIIDEPVRLSIPGIVRELASWNVP